MVVFQLVHKQCTSEVLFVDWEPPRNPDPKNPNPVSAWRTIFVANEWTELQTLRRTSTHFVLFWMGFFLVGLGLEHNATSQPNLGDRTPGHHNIVLRFANTTWWYLALSFVQWLWNYLLFERFVSEPPAQSFVDVCTVAKVSVLVLDAEYHGWYVHGDAAYRRRSGNSAGRSARRRRDLALRTIRAAPAASPRPVSSDRSTRHPRRRRASASDRKSVG